MNLLIILINVLFLIGSCIAAYFGIKLIKIKANYQKEKTLTGNFVKFMNYNDEYRYKNNRLYGFLLLIVSLFIIGICIISFFIDFI